MAHPHLGLYEVAKYVGSHVFPARRGFMPAVPKNPWDLMAIAQHFKLPTRLLDWSKNPHVALWFAVASEPEDDPFKPELWVFRPEPKDIINHKEERDPFRGRRTDLPKD